MKVKDKNTIVNTPYDDVFRTLLNDCSQLVLPVINEVFHEQYTGRERIVFSPNEHFMNAQDGKQEKRITDGSFLILGEVEKKYLFECQSTADSSMLVRIFEYATQIALDEGELAGNVLRVRIPRSAILFLRSTESTPNAMKIEMETPGGTVRFDVMVMKAQEYAIDEIFKKNLLFLIPFYIFSHESMLEEYNNDEGKLENLKAEYRSIAERLEQLVRSGAVSVYTGKTIMEMSGKVLEQIARKYQNVREGVKAVMGGRVLEYEAKTIREEGIAQGMAQGMAQGIAQGMAQGMAQGVAQGMAQGTFVTLFELVKDGILKADEAAKRANLSPVEFCRKMKEMETSGRD